MRKIWLALIVLFSFYIFLTYPAFCQNSGYFLSYSRYWIGSWPESIAIGDVNDDGLNDVVCATSYYFDPENDYKLFVFTQKDDGSGELNDPVKYDGDNGYSVDIGDFDNDSLNDVVVSTDTGIGIYYQNGSGELDAMVEIASQPTVRKVRAADLNGDGLSDVVAIGWSSDDVDVFLQSGGVLALDATYTLTYHGYPDLEVGDLNDDGLNDIVVTSGQGVITEGISILFQDPGTPGTFISPTYYEASFFPNGVAVGDLDSDGDSDPDLIVAEGNTVEVFYQNDDSPPTLDPPTSYATAGNNNPVLVGDVDSDGRLDAIIAASITLSVLFQQGGGTLDGLETYDLPYATWLNPHGMALGDINSDDMDDLAFANYNYGVVILWGWDGTPAIVIRNPGGGDSYDLGSSITIQWDSIGDIDEVNISYSTNGGTTWINIESNVPNNGYYSWDQNLPTTPAECLVRVVDSESSTMGESVWPFFIGYDGAGLIIVTWPGDTDTLVADETFPINWDHYGDIDTVKIEYSTDNGSTWNSVADSLPADDGTYQWTVPNTPSTECKIKIIDEADEDITGTSDGNFTILAPGSQAINVTAPNGGESLNGGSTYPITWNSANVINVTLWYSTDNGSNWNFIASGLDSTSNTGSYNWNVPNVSSSQCLVRITDTSNPLISDQSNGVFSIESLGDATATVVSPNGGEFYCIGIAQEISWATTGTVGNVRIQYSTDNGSSWKDIVSSTENNGSYLWTVPNDPSSQCLVRVREASDGNPSDTSDSVFTIAECGATLSITSPKGGEAWQVESMHDITWVSGAAAGSNVKLQYSTNNQATWKTITSSTANDGSYSWTVPNTPSTTCNIKISDAADGNPYNISYGTFSIVSGSVKPEISLNRIHLYYGSMKSSTAKTGIQTITVNNNGYGTLKWQASLYDLDEKDNDDLGWLKLNNITGTESGRVEVYVNPHGLAVGTYTGAVKITSADASNSPQLVNVTLKVYASQGDADPFGSFDTPIDGSTVMSSIPVTGWALDDIGIDQVTIWRNSVTGEGSGEVYIGEAVMVEGPRPDVEQAFPTYPMSYKAGWGYMLLTNMLPNGGNGTFTLVAYAKDLAGRQVKLGSKTITCDNAHSVKPFGAIDTPTQGGEATGSNFRNQGWVLTPMPNKIPINGSTIKVYVDGGQPIGTTHYNIYRMDIATLFPGYANSNGALGYLDFDTTAYESGVHTIQWVATDNAGNTDGIGSRYFYIQNSGYNSHSANKESTTGKSTGGKTRHRFSDLLEIPLEFAAPIKMRTGYKKGVEPRTITADKNGMIHINIPQDERIVLDLNQPQAQSYTGYLFTDQLRPLPPGASMDTKGGIFYWQPGPASFGKYQLVFITKSETGTTGKRIVTIEVTPKFSRKTVVKNN